MYQNAYISRRILQYSIQTAIRLSTEILVTTRQWKEYSYDSHFLEVNKYPHPSAHRPRDTTCYMLKWVHTCNVTTYRNAVTLQVTDTIRSYDLNFHPVPHDVTVSCERYTMGLPVRYGSQKHHECKESERSGR
jgi:hypothetical protein